MELTPNFIPKGGIAMLRTGTVFIIGAAVSHELGFPLGTMLKDRIARSLIQEVMSDYVRYALHSKGQQSWLAVDQLVRSLSGFNSIDNLVEFFSGNEAIVDAAKIAIASAILEAEISSGLSHQQGHTSRVEVDNVYGDLFKLIVQGSTPPTIADAFGRVSFITFNYDRSIEQYFLRMIVEATSLGWHDAFKALRSLKVFHCYGSLGEIDDNCKRPYGSQNCRADLVEMAGDLRTFSEGVRSDEGQAIKTMVNEAERLVFLGCFPHAQNMRLLKPEGPFRAKPVYATLYVPPPNDPGELSKPSIDEFTTPARGAFANTFVNWSVGAGGVPSMTERSCRVHAYTADNWLPSIKVNGSTRHRVDIRGSYRRRRPTSAATPARTAAGRAPSTGSG